MTSKFTVTVEHDDTIKPSELEDIIDQQIGTSSECYSDLDGSIQRVTVEPR